MIPKIIHYCWFGGNPLPEIAQKCIASWIKCCPDYEMILWNEANFDVNIVLFTAQVAKTKKWGFIVDYIRAYVVYYYGGIYLDTDVELLKSFDNEMLQNKCFSCFEDDLYVNPGNVFAGEKGSVIAKELLNFYSSYNFIKEDGGYNITPSPRIFTNILLKYGLKQDNTFQNLAVITVYPNEYFCPMSFYTKKMVITKNTHSIHHFDGSWLSPQKKKIESYRRHFDKLLGKYISNIIISFLVSITDYGIKYTFKKAIRYFMIHFGLNVKTNQIK